MAGRRRRLRARPGVALAVAVALWSAPCASGYPASPFSVWDRMAVSTQPSSGTGGTPLSVQPCVALLDQQNRLVNTDNNSYYVGKRISARFVSSKLPVGAPWAVLQQEGVDTTLVYPSAPISGGYACFSGLKVSDLARGYVINFYSVDDARQVDSAPFNILLGPPDALVVMQQPGSAFGGEPFLPQPRVGVVDRGLNPVSTLPVRLVSASATQTAGSETSNTMVSGLPWRGRVTWALICTPSSMGVVAQDTLLTPAALALSGRFARAVSIRPSGAPLPDSAA